MEVLKIRFTRGDCTTTPGGIILYKKDDMWIAHHFTRDYGSKKPKEFFWGRYCTTEERGIAAFNEKVFDRMGIARGGSLIPDEQVDITLELEKSHVPD